MYFSGAIGAHRLPLCGCPSLNLHQLALADNLLSRRSSSVKSYIRLNWPEVSYFTLSQSCAVGVTMARYRRLWLLRQKEDWK